MLIRFGHITLKKLKSSKSTNNSLKYEKTPNGDIERKSLEKCFFLPPPRGKTMHLRQINCTPLERGDRIHKNGYQPHILEPIV